MKKKNLPADLKTMSYADMERLAGEIRQKLVKTCAKTGGHLASNLGVVELSIAMHRCFDSPTDRFVFDVGHQGYTHKILTGRTKSFATLRQEGGISGFCRPGESPHDIFSTGHSGTAASAALGLVEGARIRGDGKSYTVAVIGDGSMTGGMVYEALNNNRGEKGQKLIIILNENEMSISKNVGAFAQYLADIRAKPTYTRFKNHTENFLRRIPIIGDTSANFVSRIKSILKNHLYSSTWFEEMGFHYIGPIDGHCMPTLVRAMQSAKLLNKPVLIHILTTKGKGYEPAESNPSLFHGVDCFDPATGKTVLQTTVNSKQPSAIYGDFSQTFGAKLCELAVKKSDLCAITAAMSLGTGLTEFAARFPGRFFDVGIAEPHAVAFAGGLARDGVLPVFAVYSTFLQRCYDQIWHDVAMQGQKVIFAVDRAGFVSGDGESHQGLYDISMLSGIPNLEIFSPASCGELQSVLDYAVYKAKNSVCIRYPRGCEKPLPAGYSITGGAWSSYGSESADICLVTYGRLFEQSAKAAEILKTRGVEVRIIKLNRVLPISKAAVKSALSSKAVYFFEEGVRFGGVGERFGASLLENGFCGTYKITAVQVFVTQGSIESLMSRFGLDAAGQVCAVIGQ
ncbi:MAG: 1-deoxy-D-xylulose-5-phosphate synthase [Oscillospiraceae bacterium]|nr:1-deoxy-D-xylulose-5-phosphate synthase [Oscillospiraceae bacterium]